MTSRRDVKAGKLAPKIIDNGAVVSPGLQVNELTLVEHQELCPMRGHRLLSRDEALALYSCEEVEEYFGPDLDEWGWPKGLVPMCLGRSPMREITDDDIEAVARAICLSGPEINQFNRPRFPQDYSFDEARSFAVQARAAIECLRERWK